MIKAIEDCKSGDEDILGVCTTSEYSFHMLNPLEDSLGPPSYCQTRLRHFGRVVAVLRELMHRPEPWKAKIPIFTRAEDVTASLRGRTERIQAPTPLWRWFSHSSYLGSK